MKTFAIASLFLSSVFAAALDTRAPDNTQLILSDLTTISNQITTTNTTLNGLKKGDSGALAVALQIQQQTNTLIADVQKAGNDSAASAKLSNAETSQVATAVLNLTSKLYSFLNNLVAHKPAFSTVLFGGDISLTVRGDLIKAKNATNAFGAALVPKLSGPLAAFAPNVIKDISNHFDSAIANFSTCIGTPCYPDLGPALSFF